MGKFRDLTGEKFGRLVVVERAENKGSKTAWLCRCECEEKVVVRGSDLKGGRTKSCGCLNREKIRERNTSHGLSHHPLYAIWENIKRRCYNENTPLYSDYGGRGISMCDEWREDFKVFYDWCIENRWKRGLEIDRIDNDEGYEPGNCRIATRQQNLCNRRPFKNSSSEYKGVYWHKRKNKWVAVVRSSGEGEYIGAFDSEIEAALAYDKAAVECHKEFAWLNRDHFEGIKERATNGI